MKLHDTKGSTTVPLNQSHPDLFATRNTITVSDKSQRIIKIADKHSQCRSWVKGSSCVGLSYKGELQVGLFLTTVQCSYHFDGQIWDKLLHLQNVSTKVAQIAIGVLVYPDWGVTTEYPMYPAVLGLGLGLGVGSQLRLGLGLRIPVRD